MTEFKHLTNLCEFIANREQFVKQFNEEYSIAEIKQLFAEHVFNLIAEVDVKESVASDIADNIADAYFKCTKELKDIKYKFVDSTLQTTVLFDDDTTVYITVERGMIYVSDCDYTELIQRINNDDTESFEAYDTTDGCDYYMRSVYAEYINCSLLQIANRFL